MSGEETCKVVMGNRLANENNGKGIETLDLQNIFKENVW